MRAYDTTRYRNFRTFTSPRPAQFSSLAVDVSGDLVASGATDVYEVFLWSVATGHLLEVISGHEGPVSCLAFNPSPASGASQLATASWDKTLKIWDALSASSSTTETIEVIFEYLPQTSFFMGFKLGFIHSRIWNSRISRNSRL